ncbi:MAG: hypothetical protein CMO36_01105 [Verrucomicrobiaceae bacterium]|nr:hypothetical protein [Verrucomicrobiaceae bacterium]
MSADQSVKFDSKPTFHIAKGLNDDGSLLKYYKRGLDYAVNYFGNYGPYHVYLFGPEDEKSVRAMFKERAMSRIDPSSKETVETQVDEFLSRPNVVEEIKSILAGESSGGLTWTLGPIRIYEDITTNATERAKRPVENTWGAMHEYHHVFQITHSAAEQERTADKNSCSWMREGMATYSSAKFMENLKFIDLREYMLELRKYGANISRPGINEFIKKNPEYRLDNETYWDEGGAPQVYYMIGAWATAYLIHAKGIDEKIVLRDWWYDIVPMGKAAAFKKHMKISLEDFYKEFDSFIRKSDKEVMKIFEKDK